jgi:hypothetical protein
MPDFQLSNIIPNRSAEYHEGWTSSLVAAAFLGCPDPWTKPQLRYMLEGFLTPIGSTQELTISQVISLSLSHPCRANEPF